MNSYTVEIEITNQPRGNKIVMVFGDFANAIGFARAMKKYPDYVGFKLWGIRNIYPPIILAQS